jgi:hypothetical protein
MLVDTSAEMMSEGLRYLRQSIMGGHLPTLWNLIRRYDMILCEHLANDSVAECVSFLLLLFVAAQKERLIQDQREISVSKFEGFEFGEELTKVFQWKIQQLKRTMKDRICDTEFRRQQSQLRRIGYKQEMRILQSCDREIRKRSSDIRNDLELIAEYFRLLSEEGKVIGERNDAYCLKHGRGVPQDVAAAMKHYQNAAKMDVTFSRCHDDVHSMIAAAQGTLQELNPNQFLDFVHEGCPNLNGNELAEILLEHHRELDAAQIISLIRGVFSALTADQHVALIQKSFPELPVNAVFEIIQNFCPDAFFASFHTKSVPSRRVCLRSGFRQRRAKSP